MPTCSMLVGQGIVLQTLQQQMAMAEMMRNSATTFMLSQDDREPKMPNIAAAFMTQSIMYEEEEEDDYLNSGPAPVFEFQ